MPFWRKKPTKQKLVLENKTSAPMQIWAEVMPDLYVLHPGDQMVLESYPSPSQDYFHIQIVEGGEVVIFSPGAVPDQVFINGKPVEPSNQGPPQPEVKLAPVVREV